MPLNVCPLLFAAEHALQKPQMLTDTWVSRMLGHRLSDSDFFYFAQPASLERHVTRQNASRAGKDRTSRVDSQVLDYDRPRKSFGALEGRALKEISDQIDGLFSPPSYPSPKSSCHSRSRPFNTNSNNNNPLLRSISQLSRNLTGTMTTRARGASSGAGGDTTSLKSAAWSSHSFLSYFVGSSIVSTPRYPGVSLDHHHHHREHRAGHGNSNGPADVTCEAARFWCKGWMDDNLELEERPDSKLLPSSTSIKAHLIIERGNDDLYEEDETGEQGQDDDDSWIGEGYDRSDVGGDDRSDDHGFDQDEVVGSFSQVSDADCVFWQDEDDDEQSRVDFLVYVLYSLAASVCYWFT
ncbi:hypothetical protein CVT26_010174 [Gymnopilus dilepis]|uniref:Uncharacterized protein n=1 Tax=Gymnopilus dilepis TaxID=231916 RepID=A0A409WCT6_9AGAR|nr:hypothetical protein CVT26_010174 [Gymnopilus dilepis]